MDQNIHKISILFKEKKFEELILHIEKNFKYKSAQILNILAVSRLLKFKDANSMILALQEFKEAYIKEKKTKYGLEALINFINTASDLYESLNIAQEKIFKSSDYLDESNSFFKEAELHFGYNKKLISAVLRVFKFQCQIKKVLFYYKLLLDKEELELNSIISFIFYNSYLDNWTQKDYFIQTKSIEKKIETLSDQKLFRYNNQNNKKIRIGFLSRDILKKHSVTYFLKTVLYTYNKNIFDVFLFIDNEIEDENTKEFTSSVDYFHNLSKLSTLEAINLIREKKLDIIVDLMGLTSVRGLSIFKNRVAHKQISWLGYNNTTGLENMDYLIADQNLIYPEDEKFYQEKIIFLPDIWACHSGESFKINKTDHPFLKNKYITFGSFNNFKKITEKVIRVWSSILKLTKNSKLVLKSSEKIDYNYLKLRFKKYGVFDSVVFIDKLKLQKHFELYNEIDIALDTFPYNGVTTTFEAILMGVPVVTMKGFNFNSRCGESININLDRKNLIANDEADYIDIASKLGNNKLSLVENRNFIKEKAYSTPLFDIKKFSNNFFNSLEKVYNNL